MQTQDHPVPPVAPARPKRLEIHGDVRFDGYFWLRERDNPAVIAYLEAENDYTAAVMAHTEELQERLYQEMRGRIKETDVSVPEQIDDYFYYRRTEEGKQYPIYCRKRDSLEATEEILLDQNALAEEQDFLRLGMFRVSPDHRYLAYSVDTRGSESYTLHVKDLESSELLPDAIPNTYYGLEWANDSRTLFYTTLDEARRPYKLFRHALGSDPARDPLVYHETDDSYFLSMRKTRSQAFILIQLNSKVTSEVRFLPARRPDAEPAAIHPRQHGVEYYVEHHVDDERDRFFITTNDGAVNFRVMEAPVATPGKEHWREVLPHRETVRVEGVDAFRNHLVVHERENGLRQMRIVDLGTDEVHYVDFPEPVYTVRPERNPVYDTGLLRFTYTSLVTPDTVFDYDMDSRDRELKKQDEVKGYNAGEYRCERHWATARDGAQVPISLVYRKGVARDGSSPTLLYGYGSYGISIDPAFQSNRLSLLDRGFIFAIAHVRGGGEMGRPWYESGKFLHKVNTFTDFIACAGHLIDLDYTSPERLVIQGRSAGGLLMGAVTNMRPELFAGVVAGVPFVDVVNTMLDPSIPLTVIEYEEWGNPNDETYYNYMRSYSPYDNVEARDYPNILATAGLNDPRVQYWEPAKWVARLRATKTDGNRLLLKTNMGAGHAGASGRYDYLKEVAFEYAFVIDTVAESGADNSVPGTGDVEMRAVSAPEATT